MVCKCGKMPVGRARVCRFCGAETVVAKADRLVRAVLTWCAMAAGELKAAADVIEAAKKHRPYNPSMFTWGFLQERRQDFIQLRGRYKLDGSRHYTCKGCGSEAPPKETVCDQCREPFRAGDVVFHRPTREFWVLACDEAYGYVYPAGYPESRGRAEDCRLSEAADDAQRIETLRQTSSSSGVRATYARAALAALEESGR